MNYRLLSLSVQIVHTLPNGSVRHHRRRVYRSVIHRYLMNPQQLNVKHDVNLLFFSAAVAGLIDSLIYHSARVIQKKIELGKAS